MKGEVEDYKPMPNFMKMPTNFARNGVSSQSDMPDYIFSPEAYEKALSEIVSLNAPYLPGAIRLAKAKKAFLHAATMGEFETVVREANGIHTRPLDPDIWSLINEHNVFSACTLNPSEPKSIFTAGTKFLPVMVDRASFVAWQIEVTAKRRVADDHDAAQNRGKVATRSDQNLFPDQKALVQETGLKQKTTEAVPVDPANEADHPLIGTPDFFKLRRPVRERIALKHYADRVRLWTGGPKGPPTADDCNWYQKSFGLGRKYARDARQKLAPDEWKRTGGKGDS